MSTKIWRRKHATCPYCQGKPLISIQENSERVPDIKYIRHSYCPYCGNKIEIVMHEYLGRQGQFQRGIHIRKITTNEDSEFKKRQRVINIYSH